MKILVFPLIYLRRINEKGKIQNVMTIMGQKPQVCLTLPAF